jgi:hypothetical protein
MLDYIMKMVEYICSGDQEEDRRNMELLAQSILERSLELHRQQIALNQHSYSLSPQQDISSEETKEEDFCGLKDDTLHRLSYHVAEGTKPPTKEEVMQFLQVLRDYYLQQRSQGKIHEKIV